MEHLPEYPADYFDLALCDPPYGIGSHGEVGAKNSDRWNNPKLTGYKAKQWDRGIPSEKYFTELLRISRNQIIWGGNFYANFLPNSKGWIVWDKRRSGNYSKCELAYSSFDKPINLFVYLWNGFQKAKQVKRIHPTQKPVQLYRWLLTNYAEPGDLILDTHVGSASSLIACEIEGFDYIGYEIDGDYYQDATERIEKAREKLRQQTLF